MQKALIDLSVVDCAKLGDRYVAIKLTPANGQPLPKILPGQFVQVKVDNSASTFLRRPISVNFVDEKENTLDLLVRIAGDGTRTLSELKKDDVVNVLLPLGNTFPIENLSSKNVLLIGGGVGVAPLLYYGYYLKNVCNANVEFLLGARTQDDLLLLDKFEAIGTVHTTTEDGSHGTKGFVTNHPALCNKFATWCVCGPAPMMKAVAAKAKELRTGCYVSLENMMACGLGACLCCVEKTVKGNVCVCTEGPVFNINQLTW
jgi:dihydroorotate dehydrogenase electron transfer subunit